MKVNPFSLLLVSLFALSQPLISQTVTPTEPCGFDQVINQLEQQYPGYKKHFDEQSANHFEPAQQPTVTPRKKIITDTTYFLDTTYYIPVVFHVIYSNASENVHDSLLKSQIEVLNRDFNRLNPDTTKTRAVFKPIVGSARIKFVLATVDPNGLPTTGIVRKATTVTQWGTASFSITDNMKYSSSGGDDAWNAQKYLNIWVCDLSYNNQDAILGYAYPPVNHPSWTSGSWVGDDRQGVVIHYKVIGRNNPRATGLIAGSNMGRCAVHEVGHFFGMRHIWGDAASCLNNDFIKDTPGQTAKSNFNCNLNVNTCKDVPKDMPDMVENYMDYSAESCQNSYTKEQVRVMRNAIRVFRNALPIQIKIDTAMRIFDTIVYNDVLVYTRPDNRNIVVELNNETLKDQVSVTLYNSIGQIISPEISLTTPETRFQSDRLSPGIYVAVITQNSTHRVVKKQKLLLF